MRVPSNCFGSGLKGASCRLGGSVFDWELVCNVSAGGTIFALLLFRTLASWPLFLVVLHEFHYIELTGKCIVYVCPPAELKFVGIPNGKTCHLSSRAGLWATRVPLP